LLLFTFLLSSQTGCGLSPNVIIHDPYGFADNRNYNTEFDATWAAVIRAMEWYPIITIEKDSGILVTDWVYGQSPNIIRRSMFGSRSDEYGIGVLLAKLEADKLVVIDILDDGPAAKAGIMKGDLVVSVNDEPVSAIPDFVKRMRAATEVVICVSRGVSKDQQTFRIKPTRFTIDELYVPVEAMYRINIRASRLSQSQTEIKVINHEKADFGQYVNGIWISNFERVDTATIREKEILDRIEAELQQTKRQ